MTLVGSALVILAAILWGISGGLGGFLMDKGLDPLVISFYRGTVGLLCILVWFAFKPMKLNKKLILWSVLAGIGIAGNFMLYFISISEASVAIAATLMYTAPIFVLLISFVFNLEKASLYKWFAIAMVLAGVVLLTEVYSIDSDSITFLGIAAGLGAGVSYALFLFGFKKATQHGDPQGVLTVAFLTLTVLISFFIDRNEVISAFNSSDFGWLILLGIIGAGISFFFYVIGLRGTVPTSASVIAMVEPVTASLFGVFVLGEMLSFTQLAGMGIILGTVTFLSVKQS